MVSVNEAHEIIGSHLAVLPAENLPLAESIGRVLSEDVYSPVHLPPFDQSAMDGYALVASDLASGTPVRIAGESSAGNPYTGQVKPGTCVRIFTGAVVPEGADTVVVVENTSEENGILLVRETNTRMGQNIRTKGSQTLAGSLALPAGTMINPATAGFLAMMGITQVQVSRNPRIAILVTGSELVPAGQALAEGQIYESNGITLRAALRSLRLDAAEVVMAGDSEELIAATVARLLRENDMLLVSGGISVGKYDFTGKALLGEGVTEHFYKIAQKPGKPLFFGTKENKAVFGLPGNPASALTCFYEYVHHALRCLQGEKTRLQLPQISVPLASDWKKKPGLTNFLKGKIEGGKVFPLEGQESFMLNSFAVADCLICIPADAAEVKAGTPVNVRLLPLF